MNDGLVLSALKLSLKNVNELSEKKFLSDSTKHELGDIEFDLVGLIGIFCGNYKVTIEISEKDFENFAENHGVDFPRYIDLEVVDIVESQPQGETVVDYNQRFEYLAYLEDGALSFGLRSNKPFPGADDEGADPQNEDSNRYHLYQEAEKGQAIVFKGTTFVAAPTDTGWVIIENGEIVEEIDF